MHYAYIRLHFLHICLHSLQIRLQFRLHFLHIRLHFVDPGLGLLDNSGCSDGTASNSTESPQVLADKANEPNDYLPVKRFIVRRSAFVRKKQKKHTMEKEKRRAEET
jgi:hypothetical protein